MVLLVIFGVQYDRPARREDVVVGLKLVRFEANASKDRRDGQRLTIGKMYGRRCHRVLVSGSDRIISYLLAHFCCSVPHVLQLRYRQDSV